MKKISCLSILLFCMITCRVYAQDGIPGLGGPSEKGSPLWFKIRHSVTEDSRVKIQNSNLTLSLDEFDLGARLWRNLPEGRPENPAAKKNFMKKEGPPPDAQAGPGMNGGIGFPGIKQLSASFSYKRRAFRGTAILPASGDQLPEEFYSIKTALTYMNISGKRKLWGLRAGIGFASDEPFASSDLSTTDALFFMSRPAGKRDSWMFFLYYSDNRAVLNHIPLPGFAYLWKPEKNFQILAGIPFLAMKWSPAEKLEVNLSVNPSPGGKAEVVYKSSETVSLFGIFQTKSESYIRDDRLEYWDRLFLYESQLQAGVRMSFGKTADFELSGSYKFDRYIFEGDGYEDRDTNRIELENGLSLKLALTLRF